MVVVTGATGHIGNTLVRLLVEQGLKVSCLVLPNDNLCALEKLKVKIVYGDVQNPASLLSAFEGVDLVYHLAGLISISRGKSKRLESVNVQGTLNVIQAAKASHVKRLLYVSSIHAIKEPEKGQAILETSEFHPNKVHGNYAKSKAAATRHVLNAAGDDLECVVVHPSGVIGPYEFQPSNMGQLVHDYLNKKLFAYVEGAYDFVDVRDVAMGILQASKKGKSGETYILSGEQIKVSSILGVLETLTDIKAPKLKLPTWFAIITADLSELYYALRRQPPLFTRYSIQTLLSNSLTSHRKASRMLNYQPRSLKQSLADTVNWVKSHAYIYDKTLSNR